MPQKYALIIGIENYPESSGQDRVKYAINDCNALARYFEKDAGFTLEELLLDEKATYTGIISALDRLFYYAEPDDTIALFYAGHGHYTELGGYLIPHSYRKGEEFNEATCVSFDSINKRLKTKNPRNFLFLLDTCHSGSALDQIELRKGRGDESGSRDIAMIAPNIEKQLEDMVREQTQDTARVIFTSCSAIEKSQGDEQFQHGVFTHYLLEGLSGKTGSGKDFINIEELIPLTKNRVVAYCKEKSKQHGSVCNQTPCAFMHINYDFRLPLAGKVKYRKIETIIDFSQEINRAEELIKNKDYGKAISVLKNIIEQDNLHWEAMQLLQKAEELKSIEADQEKEEILRTFEQWLQRGAGFLKEGKIDDADSCLEKAEQIFPADARVEAYKEQIKTARETKGGTTLTRLRALFEKAEDLKQEGKYFQLLQLYDQILSIHPENERVPEERPELLNQYIRMKAKQFLEQKITKINAWLKQRDEWLNELAETYDEFKSVGMGKEAAEIQERIEQIKVEKQSKMTEEKYLRKITIKEADRDNNIFVILKDLLKNHHIGMIINDPYLIELLGLKEIGRDENFIAYEDGTVLDTKTGLMWSAEDNGKSINWKYAKAYCENFEGGGYTDWRMPTIDELESLYDKNKSYPMEFDTRSEVHLTELIYVSCWFIWSSEVNGSSASRFYFHNGYRTSAPQSQSGDNRALPVRVGILNT